MLGAGRTRMYSGNDRRTYFRVGLLLMSGDKKETGEIKRGDGYG